MSTTTYEWTAVRARAIHAFNGDLPTGETEAVIIEVFETYPDVVSRAIDQTAAKVASGKVRNGWAILKLELQGATEPLRDVIVHGNNRQRLVEAAERFIRNAGVHFDRQDEIEDALFVSTFGGRGQSLRAWADDQVLRDRLVRLWREHRPAGARAETGHERWCADAKERRAAVVAATRPMPSEEEAA